MQTSGHPQFSYEDEGGVDPLDDLDRDDERGGSKRARAQRRRAQTSYAKPGRRPSTEREGSFNALLWVLDGATGLMEELRHNDLGLSEEFWMHAYAARRESLLAVRALLETWIDEDKEDPASPVAAEQLAPKSRRGSINIDF